VAAIALRWPAGGELLELPHGFVLGRGFEAQLFAGFGLAIESLRDGCRPAHFAQKQNLDFELSTGTGDIQHVPDSNFARSFGWLAIPADAAEIAGLRGQSPRLEESGGPKPFVDADGGHDLVPIQTNEPICFMGSIKKDSREID